MPEIKLTPVTTKLEKGGSITRLHLTVDGVLVLSSGEIQACPTYREAYTLVSLVGSRLAELLGSRPIAAPDNRSTLHIVVEQADDCYKLHTHYTKVPPRLDRENHESAPVTWDTPSDGAGFLLGYIGESLAQAEGRGLVKPRVVLTVPKGLFMDLAHTAFVRETGPCNYTCAEFLCMNCPTLEIRRA